MASAAVYEVRLELGHEALKFYNRRVGRRRRDWGYMVKGALAAILFGDASEGRQLIKPWYYGRIKGGTVPVRGYSTMCADQLRWQMQQFGDPEAVSMVDPRSICSKPMARYWSPRVGFSVVANPRDNYYEARTKLDPSMSREEVYVEWLSNQLGRTAERATGSGAKLIEATMISARRLMATRCGAEGRREGEQERKEYETPIETIELTGTLEIESSRVFSEFLLGGIGKNKAFGYGMLRIHDVGTPCP